MKLFVYIYIYIKLKFQSSLLIELPNIYIYIYTQNRIESMDRKFPKTKIFVRDDGNSYPFSH